MRITLVPLLFLAIAPLSAQQIDNPYTTHPYNFDSGYLDNDASAPRSVFTGRVRVTEAIWMRLHLHGTNLPAGSRLTLTATDDGAVQRFDGASLRDYADLSAFFNGSEVVVDLIAGAGTRGNRVNVRAVDGGELRGVVQPTSICGTTDDRQLSTDPRQGRQSPTGCTSWLIGPALVLTAGHCTASSSQAIHFNVPLSSSTGGLRMPPVEDQYPYDAPTMQRLSSGVGSDWAVVTTVRNSNTGLYPGQRQGAWYELGPVPTSTAGQTIRITGYGSISSPVSPTWQQVQKTHTGGLSRVQTTSLCYTPDTTGGNSGSPVIHENTGRAIGIHTHGGCNSTGGCNSGTRIDRVDLQTAIASLRDRKRAGLFTALGAGCVGTSGTPTLATVGFPDQGATFRCNVTGVRSGQPGAMLVGGSTTSWNGLTLPFDLQSLGAPGCALRTSIDVTVTLATGAGAPTTTLAVPRNAALIGGSFHLQYASVDPGSNGLGLTLSNALRATIGD